MKFFTFMQNNSGGSFVFDEKAGITHVVIVEARDARMANALAQSIGLYFNGEGDCNCCGDRWSELWGSETEGSDEPTVYGHSIIEWATDRYFLKWMEEKPEVFVHHLDGRIVGHLYGVEGMKR